MLFDLQTRRRRTAVKIIYSGLALLMGGGLILFGIGTGTGSGGLFDLFNNQSTSTHAQVSAQVKSAEREIKLNPKNANAWGDLARARFQTAEYDQATGTFTAAGKDTLASAVQAWQRYLVLQPQHPSANIALLMVQAYAGLNDPANAAQAVEIVTQSQPTAAYFGQLAQYSYLAGEFRKGDLAAGKAVQLAPKAQRATVKQQLATARKQARQPGTAGTPTTPSG